MAAESPRAMDIICLLCSHASGQLFYFEWSARKAHTWDCLIARSKAFGLCLLGLLTGLLEEEDWRAVCETSLFRNHVERLEHICKTDFNNNDSDFLKHYLRPVVTLLDSIRSSLEEHYTQGESDTDPPWIDRFERVVTFALHPGPIDVQMHKGDFYIHVSPANPRKLQIKYYDSASIHSRTLSTGNCVQMCSQLWTDELRSEAKSRFVYSNCIVWTKRGFDRKTWKQILCASSLTPSESHILLERVDSTEMSSTEKEAILAELNEKPLHILDLDFELLHSQVAYLPGSRDDRGGAVIVVSANSAIWENSEINSTELARLFMYYFRIPRESVQNCGCSFIIDARKGNKIRDILVCIGEGIALFQEKFPNAVRMAYIVMKKDSLLLLMSASKIRDKLNFEFQLVSNMEKLYKVIPQQDLPVDLGGDLGYNHDQWIKFRIKLEPFMAGCRSAAKHARAYIQELGKLEYGTSAEETRQLLEQHEKKVKEVLEDSRLTNLMNEGKQIIDRIQDDYNELPTTEDYSDTIQCVHSLYNQMNHLFDKLQEYSSKRKRKLQLCLQLRTFDEEGDRLINWLHSEGDPFLDTHADTGDSIGHVRSLQGDFSQFQSIAKENCAKATEMINSGRELLELDYIPDDRDWIRERLDRLEDAFNNFSLKFDERKKTLKQSMHFHTLIEQASNWSLECLRYIAQMNMEDLQTKEGTEKLREELDQFLTDNPPSSESQLARITELAHHLGSKQLKMQAEQVSSRCKEVEDMIIKRQNMIKSAENRLKDTLELPPSDDASSGFSSNPRDDDLSTEAGDDNKDSVDSMGPMFSWKQDAGRGYDENDELIAAFDTAMPSKMKERLKYIVQEIIDTERDYVESLEYVIKHYLPEMDKEYLPPTLAGRKNILFGNMKLNTMQRMLSIIQLSEADLLSVYFSQELENYQHSPLQIGKCFLKWERQFYIYALYNKNKPKSDTILNDYGNAYFRTKQNELGDKLNLASFLIKPVQRLGKYALLLKVCRTKCNYYQMKGGYKINLERTSSPYLMEGIFLKLYQDMADYISSYRPWIIKLKDMTSCCSLNDPRLAELKAAQEMMKFQLRHGNDLLAMDSVRDCDVNLKEQGCLLRQGDFMVWIGRRKRLRRVFLFEDLVLFTKAKKQAGQGDRFMSKHSLKTADMGVTENIGESGLKFELWYRRMKRGKATESYVLQATNTEIKNSWVADITKILWRQAQRNKDYELTEVTTGISIESQPSGLYSEMPMTVQSPAPAIVRSKSADSAASNQGKRLSWLSAESSNTSGVHDLGSLPEETGVYFRRDQDVNGQNIMDSSTDQAYSTLPRNSFRKPKGIEINPEVKMSYVTEALVDIPQTRVRFRDTGMDGAFIRNTLHRRTLHVDKQLDRNVIEDQHSPRRHSIDKSPQHLSRSYSDTESSASSRNVSINDSIKSPSYSDYAISPDRPTSPLRSVTFDESEEDITDNKPRSQSDIINAEEQTIGKSNSSDIATSSEAFLCQSSPTLADEKAVRRESDGKKDKQRQKASKEKRLSLGALLGRKKKPSTSS